MKAARTLGKNNPDYDPLVYYGDSLWTRVKSRAQLEVKRIVTFDLGPDIKEDFVEVKHKVNNILFLGK